MLWPALQDPDPVIIFEHGSLYNMSGELAEPTRPGRHQPRPPSGAAGTT